MTDVAFREKQSPAVESEGVGKNPASSTITSVEPPFLDYSRENGKPFTVEHFQLGDRWDDSLGGFSVEVSAIENYLESQVMDREIENSLPAIKKRIKEIEKITGVDKEDRKVIKLEVIAEYTRFLMKKSDFYKNIKRYDNN